jgi:hypothetical protein
LKRCGRLNVRRTFVTAFTFIFGVRILVAVFALLTHTLLVLASLLVDALTLGLLALLAVLLVIHGGSPFVKLKKAQDHEVEQVTKGRTQINVPNLNAKNIKSFYWKFKKQC